MLQHNARLNPIEPRNWILRGQAQSGICLALPSPYLAPTDVIDEQEDFYVVVTAIQRDRGNPHAGALQSG